MGESSTAWKVVVFVPERKCLLGRPVRKWYVNFEMDIKQNVLFVCFMYFRIWSIYRLF
jgi:hypothetical protein